MPLTNQMPLETLQCIHADMLSLIIRLDKRYRSGERSRGARLACKVHSPKGYLQAKGGTPAVSDLLT